MKRFLLMCVLVLGMLTQASGAGWTSYPTVPTLQGPETFLTTTVNPTNNQQIAASNLASYVVSTMNPLAGTRPLQVSTLIQPGGIVVLGDSLDVWFVTNMSGFFPSGPTNGAVVCGGTTNANVNGMGWFTNGMTLLWGEANGYTNESWLMDLTNYVKQTVGWTVPLDNALTVSGAGYMNYGDADLTGCNFEGYQAWESIGTYTSTGTNTIYWMGGMTNSVTFWGTNDYGTTNDFYVQVNSVNYSNPVPGITWTTNIFVTGSYGGNVQGIAVGAPNGLISVRDYPTRFAGSWGSATTSRAYFPPLYQNNLANDPLIYLTNISPAVTGIPKILFLPGSQNDRTFLYMRKGTNNAPSYSTNFFGFVLQRQMNKLIQIGRNLGFTAIYGASVPYSPNCNPCADIQNVNLSYSLPITLTNFDGWYDWASSNAPVQGNGAFYLPDSVHPNAALARLEATNHATFFKVKSSASIK